MKIAGLYDGTWVFAFFLTMGQTYKDKDVEMLPMVFAIVLFYWKPMYVVSLVGCPAWNGISGKSWFHCRSSSESTISKTPQPLNRLPMVIIPLARRARFMHLLMPSNLSLVRNVCTKPKTWALPKKESKGCWLSVDLDEPYFQRLRNMLSHIACIIMYKLVEARATTCLAIVCWCWPTSLPK